MKSLMSLKLVHNYLFKAKYLFNLNIEKTVLGHSKQHNDPLIEYQRVH